MNPNTKSIYLTPFQRQMLEKNLNQELPHAYRQRLEIILLTDRGTSQAEICRTLGCCTATASRWILLTKTGLAHQYLECPVGRPKIVTDEYIKLLRELLDRSPRDYGYPFKNWTVRWLGKHLAKETDIEISDSHLKRVMGELGLSTRSKTRSEQFLQTSTNIFITDLHSHNERSDRELSELTLFKINRDSKVYSAASSS